jgi:uncharacterized protein involved in outer membrane biogenesis
MSDRFSWPGPYGDRATRAWSVARPVLVWTGGILVAFIAVILLALTLIDWNRMKGPLERFASAKSGRAVTISGDLIVHPWSWTPSATVTGLAIGNPPWEPSRPMAQIDRLTVQLEWLPLLAGDVILPRVRIERPRVYLHREKSGRANWTFANTRPTDAPAPPPPDLPVVRDFLIEDGALVVVDEMRKLRFEAKVQAHEKVAQGDEKPFRIEGKGTLNEKPFDLGISGGPLVNLDPDDPYPFDLQIRAGDLRIASSGRVEEPFDLAKLSFDVKASGRDLADFYYLTRLALPNTPPFELSVKVRRDGDRVAVRDIAGTVGRSDLMGELDIDTSRKRPAVSGSLSSKRLVLGDLVASLGGKTRSSKSGSSEDDASPAGSEDDAGKSSPSDALAPGVPRLFPVARLQVDRVRGMDADVRFEARAIEAGRVPMKEVFLHVKIDDGVLSLTPFAFELPQGELSGRVRIDATRDEPHTSLDLRVRNVQLDQVKGKAPDARPALGGVLQARAVLAGSGDSVHEFVAKSDGAVTAVLPSGEIRAAFAELTGINVARGLGLLLKGDEERTLVRCGVAEFKVSDGTMRAQHVVFDTEDVLIKGSGEVRLGPEELDLSIKGEPKKLRLLRLRTPVELNGHLRKPSVGVDAGRTLKQGAIAATLSAVAAPIAAILAFVDPGLAEDVNCAALLAQQ